MNTKQEKHYCEKFLEIRDKYMNKYEDFRDRFEDMSHFIILEEDMEEDDNSDDEVGDYFGMSYTICSQLSWGRKEGEIKNY